MGNILAVKWRDWRWTIFNASLHAQFGFASMFFLIINVVLGFGALFSYDLRKLWHPIYMKFTHNLLGITTFVLGMVSLYYGYEKRFMKRNTSTEMIAFLAWGTIITTVLSCIGATKSLLRQGMGAWTMFNKPRRVENGKHPPAAH